MRLKIGGREMRATGDPSTGSERGVERIGWRKVVNRSRSGCLEEK